MKGSMGLACAFAIAAVGSRAPSLDAALSADGSYELRVNGAVWLQSADTFVTASGRKYSAKDGSLRPGPGGVSVISGTDPALGSYKGTQIEWKAGATPFVTSIKVITNPDRDEGRVVLFEQSFPEGAEGTAPVDGDPLALSNGGLSAFPSFYIRENPSLGYLTFSGRFLEASKAAPWSPNSLPPGGRSAGPFALFDSSLSCVVISHASEFMAAVTAVSPGNGGDNASISNGVMGSITSVPKGFTLRTIVRLGGGKGISSSVKGWGNTMLRLFNKDSEAARSMDPTLQWLSYATDNGAYYYGHPERLANGSTVTMQQTLFDVYDSAKNLGVPVQSVLLDSWWYTKGVGGGVKNWTAREDIFPDGIESLRARTGWNIMAHNRYWAPDTVYARQNGGDYDFIVGEKMAIPVEQRFWDDLIGNATVQWDLKVYEQDWLYNEFEGLNETLQDAALGRTWLLQMGSAATKYNVTIQYCMSYPRMVLQSLEIASVSQFRAGDDYGPGQSTDCGFPYCVYDIGTTSLIAWALGLAPSKDVFWSTTVQPGSPFGHGNATEPYNEMEAAIAVMSRGPVHSGDRVGAMNKTLLLMTCASDGSLLQPSRPASVVDAAYAQAALGSDGLGGKGPLPTKSNNPAVWSSHTAVGSLKWTHIISIGLNQTWRLRPDHVPIDVADAGQSALQGLVAYSGYGSPENVTLSGADGQFSADKPITLRPCLYSDFGLWHVAPRMRSGWVLLGEIEKFVPVSERRIQSVEAPTSSSIRVGVSGVARETVILSFLDKDNKVQTAVCAFSKDVDGVDGGGWIGMTASCSDGKPCVCE